jgi:hypothetical protein
MAKKARKKSASKTKKKAAIAKKKRKAAAKKTSKAAARKKAARPAKAKPQRKGVFAGIVGAAKAVVDTLTNAERLHHKMEPHVSREPE